MLTRNTVCGAVAQNRRRAIQLPPYQASLMFHNHGIIGDIIIAAHPQGNALLYGGAQIQPLYTALGSLMSIGGGYRSIINPVCVVGGHLYVDGGRLPRKVDGTLLPNNMGYYAKLNPGISVDVGRWNISTNCYLPICFGNFNRRLDMSQLKDRDYKGHQAYYLRYFDQDQFGWDLQGSLILLPGLQGCMGFYGSRQASNPYLWGTMIGLEYTWNQSLIFKLKYNFDNFRHHYMMGGFQIQRRHFPAPLSHRQQVLWRPLTRHVAPIQMTDNHIPVKGEHHLFFDSRVEGTDITEATYEKRCPILNQRILQSFRKDYPPNSKKILHLYGFFNLVDGKIASLVLDSEYIEGEHITDKARKKGYDSFEVLKHFPHIKLNSDDLFKAPIPPGTLDAIKIIAANERLFDGRPIIHGTISAEKNSGYHLRQLGLLPADDSHAYDVNLLKTDAEGKQTYCAMAAIVGNREGEQIKHIGLNDIVITGIPGYAKPFSYNCGIDVSRCDALSITSAWINQAETAISLRDIKLAGDNALRGIYIGSPHLSADADRMQEIKAGLRASVRKQCKGAITEATQLHNNMLNKLRHRTVNLRELLKQVEGVNVANLPAKSIVLTDLDIEGRVLIGIHVQNSIPIHKVPSVFQRKPATHKPLETTFLKISDALIMAQGIAFAVENRMQARFDHCVLGSRQLAYYANDAKVVLFGAQEKPLDKTALRLSQDSFVYVNQIALPPDMVRAIDNIPLLKNLKTMYRNQLHAFQNMDPAVANRKLLYTVLTGDASVDYIYTEPLISLMLPEPVYQGLQLEPRKNRDLILYKRVDRDTAKNNQSRLVQPKKLSDQALSGSGVTPSELYSRDLDKRSDVAQASPGGKTSNLLAVGQDKLIERGDVSGQGQRPGARVFGGKGPVSLKLLSDDSQGSVAGSVKPEFSQRYPSHAHALNSIPGRGPPLSANPRPQRKMKGPPVRIPQSLGKPLESLHRVASPRDYPVSARGKEAVSPAQVTEGTVLYSLIGLYSSPTLPASANSSAPMHANPFESSTTNTDQLSPQGMLPSFSEGDIRRRIPSSPRIRKDYSRYHDALGVHSRAVGKQPANRGGPATTTSGTVKPTIGDVLTAMNEGKVDNLDQLSNKLQAVWRDWKTGLRGTLLPSRQPVKAPRSQASANKW